MLNIDETSSDTEEDDVRVFFKKLIKNVNSCISLILQRGSFSSSQSATSMKTKGDSKISLSEDDVETTLQDSVLSLRITSCYSISNEEGKLVKQAEMSAECKQN